MKRLSYILCMALLCLTCLSCGTPDRGLEQDFAFDPSDYSVVDELDTHGGFHGDGYRYIILDCSQNADKARDIVKEWKSLPLSEPLQEVMYDSENGGYHFAEETMWPIFENDVYKFVDRQASLGEDRGNDSALLDRYSFNFSIAVYDMDSDFLYYFEMDT